MPSIVSRSAWSAEPRLIGPSAVGSVDVAATCPAGARSGTTTCWPSASRAARLIALGSASPPGAARPLDRVGDPRAGGKPVDAGLGDGAGDVDDDVAVGGRRRRPPTGSCGELHAARRRAASPPDAERPQRADAEQQQDDADRGVDGELGAAQRRSTIAVLDRLRASARYVAADARHACAVAGADSAPNPCGASGPQPTSKPARPLRLLLGHVDLAHVRSLGPSAQKEISSSTASRGPSKTTSTAPSARLRPSRRRRALGRERCDRGAEEDALDPTADDRPGGGSPPIPDQ